MLLKLAPLILIAGAGVWSQSPAIPDTPAGRQFAAWREVFNRGDRAALKAFLDKNYPSDPRGVDPQMDFREMTGGFDLKKVESSTPDTLVALLLERNSDQFGRLTLEVEPVEPDKIVRFGIMAIPRPAEFPIAHLSTSTLVAAVWVWI